MSASSTGPDGVFIGIGPADAGSEYLSGRGIDRVTDMSVDPFDLSTTRQSGAATAPAPGERDFWVASASSHSIADLSWPVQDGDHRLVVMNADGTPGLTSLAEVVLELPNAFPLSLGVLVGGGILATCGVALLTVAVSRSCRHPTDQGSGCSSDGARGPGTVRSTVGRGGGTHGSRPAPAPGAGSAVPSVSP